MKYAYLLAIVIFFASCTRNSSDKKSMSETAVADWNTRNIAPIETTAKVTKVTLAVELDTDGDGKADYSKRIAEPTNSNAGDTLWIPTADGTKLFLGVITNKTALVSISRYMEGVTDTTMKLRYCGQKPGDNILFPCGNVITVAK